MATKPSASVRRVAGRIVEWNDERGYGFVLPNGGDQKRFLHIKAFVLLKRRPAVGDAVAYAPGVDERGRPTAVDVTFNVAAAPEPAARVQGRTTWRASLGAVALVGVGVAWWIQAMPAALAVASAGASAIAFILYGWDKGAAKTDRRRTPETTLQLWALAGGWPGALIAQHTFGHKTRKAAFQRVFWTMVVLHVAAVVWLMTSDAAGPFRAALEATNA